MKAHHMVVHVMGRPPIEVDGLEWKADCAGKLLACDVYDDCDQYLGVEIFKHQMLSPGTVFRMPADVRYEESPSCG